MRRAERASWVMLMAFFLFGSCSEPVHEDEPIREPPSCEDGEKNGMETDVDCGGFYCEPCEVGGSCSFDRDCESHRCDDKVCEAPGCEDGRTNGEETDIDCGGPLCEPCAVGQSCIDDGDCESQFCLEGLCLEAQCNDGIQNGAETDVDCGGSHCPPCGEGRGCEDHQDCESQYCEGGICTLPPCDEDLTTAEQTDLYCGGPFCAACEVDQRCLEDRDCESEICRGEICRARAFTSVSVFTSQVSCVLDLHGHVYCSELMSGLPYQGDFVKIRVGAGFGCGLTTVGALECWGPDYRGQTEPPPGTYIDFDLSHHKGCAIDDEYQLHCWPESDWENIAWEMPEGRFQALSLTSELCVLDLEGKVSCPRLAQEGYMPSDRLVATKVDAGFTMACALDEEHYAHCWGHPDHMILLIDRPERKYIDIAAGNGWFCGIRKEDQMVECFSREVHPVVDDIPDVPFQQIAMFSALVCGIDIWDQVHCWGLSNSNGEQILFD